MGKCSSSLSRLIRKKAAALFPGFLGSLRAAAAQHREQGGRCLPHHPYFLHSLQLALELDDGLPDGHTLSLVPESLEAKRALPWEKREPDASGEYYQITEPFIDRMWRWPSPPQKKKKKSCSFTCSFFFYPRILWQEHEQDCRGRGHPLQGWLRRHL